MRFKATIINYKLLFSIIQCMEKVDKTGIIRLNKDKVIFIAKQTDGENTQVNGVVPTVNLFSEVRIQSKLRNEIVVEVQLKNLVAALKSANNALTIIAKLTKKHEIGYLSFEIKTQMAKGKETSNVVTVVQDVPIRVLLQEEIQAKVVEPDFSSVCQNPLIISLPKLKEMKSVIDKMKSTHNGNVEVSGSPTGQLRLVLNCPLVTIRTIYKGLHVKASPPNTANEIYTSEVTVKLKSLSRLLHAHNANPTDVNCIFVDRHALVVDVYLESNCESGEEASSPKSYLTYYITAIQE